MTSTMKAQGNGSPNPVKRRVKAQITLSFIVSAGLFVGLVIYIASTIFTIASPYFTSAARQESEAYAYMASTLLLSSPGWWDNGTANGSDWENHPENTVQLGLADRSPRFGSSYHHLSTAKINNMSGMDDSRIRSLLGEGHLYSFCISRLEEQDCGVLNRTNQIFEGATVTRFAVLENGTAARMLIKVL